MNYRDKVIEVLEEMGILIDEEDDTVALQDYIVDSVQFISLIVNLEEKLDFVFPDEYLVYESISTLETLCNIIEQSKE